MRWWANPSHHHSVEDTVNVLIIHMHVQSLSHVPTLCHPMECSPPDSFIHVIFQARILEWVANSFSRESSPPRDRTCVSCIGRQILYHWVTWEAPCWIIWAGIYLYLSIYLSISIYIYLYIYIGIYIAYPSIFHHFMANRWGNNANCDRLYFLELQNNCRWWLQPWN